MVLISKDYNNASMDGRAGRLERLPRVTRAPPENAVCEQ